jgi:hypothetical protein
MEPFGQAWSHKDGVESVRMAWDCLDGLVHESQWRELVHAAVLVDGLLN